MLDEGLVCLADPCCRAMECPAPWRAMVARLTCEPDADAADFTGFSPRFRVDHDIRHLGEDGWIDQLKALPLRRAFGDELEPEDFERAADCNEWRRHQGFRSALGELLESGSGRAVHIGVSGCCVFGARPVRHGAAGRMTRLLPHLDRALRLPDCLATQSALEQCVGSLAQPAFLLDRGGRLLAANDAAERLLRDGCALRQRQGSLVLTKSWFRRAKARGRRRRSTSSFLRGAG